MKETGQPAQREQHFTRQTLTAGPNLHKQSNESCVIHQKDSNCFVSPNTQIFFGFLVCFNFQFFYFGNPETSPHLPIMLATVSDHCKRMDLHQVVIMLRLLNLHTFPLYPSNSPLKSNFWIIIKILEELLLQWMVQSPELKIIISGSRSYGQPLPSLVGHTTKLVGHACTTQLE